MLRLFVVYRVVKDENKSPLTMTERLTRIPMMLANAKDEAEAAEMCKGPQEAMALEGERVAVDAATAPLEDLQRLLAILQSQIGIFTAQQMQGAGSRVLRPH